MLSSYILHPHTHILTLTSSHTPSHSHPHTHTLHSHLHTPTASKLGRIEPFAVAHLKLMKEDDTTIQDGEHELYVYKVRNRRRGRRGRRERRGE